jgi:hypothetical protein
VQQHGDDPRLLTELCNQWKLMCGCMGVELLLRLSGVAWKAETG